MFLPFIRPLAFLLSLAILAAGIWLGWDWWRGVRVLEADGVIRTYRGPIWELLLATAMLGLATSGRWLVPLLWPSRGEAMLDVPRGTELPVKAPDGSSLHVERSGPHTEPAIILTHGWGLASSAMLPLRRRLDAKYQVIAWDLPGLGRSEQPPDGVLDLDRFADALGAVIRASGAERVVLVGHSIGGMISQTLFRRATPDVLSKVAGVVLLNTTHTNPLRTMWGAPLWLALQKPLIEPMLRLSVPLSPVLHVLNWLSYQGGSLQLANRLVAFGRHPNREAVDLTSWLVAKNSPAVQAKGNLAMLNWSVTPDLPCITTPLLALAGTSDIITQPRASDEIGQVVPAGGVARFEGAGHCGYLELTGEYVNAIETFLRKVAELGSGPASGSQGSASRSSSLGG